MTIKFIIALAALSAPSICGASWENAEGNIRGILEGGHWASAPEAPVLNSRAPSLPVMIMAPESGPPARSPEPPAKPRFTVEVTRPPRGPGFFANLMFLMFDPVVAAVSGFMMGGTNANPSLKGVVDPAGTPVGSKIKGFNALGALFWGLLGLLLLPISAPLTIGRHIASAFVELFHGNIYG